MIDTNKDNPVDFAGTIIDRGEDSYVYRQGEKAYKVYEFQKKASNIHSLENKINYYAQMTNDAVKLCESKDYAFVFNGTKYELRINPVDRVFISEKHGKAQVVSETPFIEEGERLDKSFLNGKPEVEQFLKDVSVDINHELGIAGVNIIGYNVMVLDNELKVTDMCVQVLDLRPFGKRKFNS